MPVTKDYHSPELRKSARKSSPFERGLSSSSIRARERERKHTMQVKNKTSDLKSLAIPAEYLTVQNKHAPKSVHNQMYRAFTEANRCFPHMGSLTLCLWRVWEAQLVLTRSAWGKDVLRRHYGGGDAICSREITSTDHLQPAGVRHYHLRPNHHH